MDLASTQFLQNRLLQTTSCPSISFQESYTTTYQLSSFSILPSYNLNCGSTKSYAVVSGKSSVKPQAFTYNTTSRIIGVSNWQELVDNTFYTIKYEMTVQNPQNQSDVVLVSDTFNLVIGIVYIQYTPYGSKIFKFNDILSIDYSSAYDPQQPDSGSLTFNWGCESFFFQCSSLSKTNTFDPINRIQNRWAFGYSYQFNLTITNRNIKNLKQSTDILSIRIQHPEETNSPLSCISFNLNFRNQNYAVKQLSSNDQQLIFDSLNYTDIRITNPTINISNCASQFNNKQTTLAFTSFNNPILFDEVRSYIFNSSDIVISKSKLQSTLRTNNHQKLRFYVYLIDSVTNQISGFQYQTLTLSLNDQSLYAIATQDFIQIARDKVLYIDGSTSYDARLNNVAYNYIWGVEGFPQLSLPNQKVLTLNPEQRNKMGINQAGKYYNYTLRVSDDTRISDTIKVLLQIAPEADPNGCIQVFLKDIDIEKIITYTIWPLILQAKVTKANCANMAVGALVWECKSVDWQFWQLFGNNNTIAMDRDNLKKLPKNIDIQMAVTQYYKIKDIEYISRLTFKLFVEKPDLIPIANYPRVINVREQTLVLNATASYDPQAVATGTTNVPIICTWECPDYFKSVCSTKLTYSNNNCLVTFKSSDILAASTYSSSIQNQAHLFTLTLSKDSRVNKAYVYVTIIDSNLYPKCQIDFIEDFTVNHHARISANCTASGSKVSFFDYRWQAYEWTTVQEIAAVNSLTTATQPIWRIPPYTMNSYRQILIVLTVTDGIYSTPIALYKTVNDQSQFTFGSLNMNFNQFTAYLSTFTMTPANWDSSISSTLSFQYRYKVGNFLQGPLYRLLLAPTVSSAKSPISIFLPPFTQENSLYVDVLDTDLNFYTQKKAIMSVNDIKMLASTFLSRVNGIVQVGYYQFDEATFEQTILRLMLNFMAYKNNQIDMQGLTPSFFKNISEDTVSYLYNMVIIDQRLTSVSNPDRLILIKQNVIELLSYIATQNREIKNGNDLLSIFNLTVNSGRFHIGTMLPEIIIKGYTIIFQLSDISYSSIIDAITKRIQHVIQDFTYTDEVISYSNSDYKMVIYDLGSYASNLPDLDGYSYTKTTIYDSSDQQGSMLFIRNNTFTHLSIFDAKLNLQSFTGLSQPILISFYLSSDQLAKNKSGNLTFFCATKDDFSKPWTASTSRISFLSFNTQTGEVVCRSNQIGQHNLFIQDLTLSKNNNSGGLIDNGNQQVLDGKWNDTIGPVPIKIVDGDFLEDQGFIFERHPLLFTLLALISLAIFIVSSWILHIKYKLEHQTLNFNREEFTAFQIHPKDTVFSNRLRLFKLVLIQFNPYLNLFLIYNKFLPRWVRNSLLQIYFMIISSIFGINQVMVSHDMSQLGKQSQFELIVLFFIALLILVFGRPWAVKLMYKLLYEPDSKVENDYLVSTQQINGKHENIKDITIDDKHNRIVEFEDSSKKLDDFEVQPQLQVDKDPKNQIRQSQQKQSKFEEPIPKIVSSKRNSLQNSIQATPTKYQSIEQPEEEPRLRFEGDAQEFRIKPSANKKLNKLNKQKLSAQKKNNILKNQQKQISHRELQEEDQSKEEFKLQDKFNPSIDTQHKEQLNAVDSLKLPDIFQKPKIIEQLHSPRFHEIDISQLSQQSQSLYKHPNDERSKLSQEINIFDNNFFDQFQNNNNNNNFQHEGGEQEEDLQERELNNSLEEVQEPTSNFPTYINHNQREENMHPTEFLREPSPENNQIKKQSSNQDQLHNSGILEQQDSLRSQDQYNQPSEVIMDDNKKVFINKIIGKLLLLLIWVALIILNIKCLENMRMIHFYKWLELTIITFAIMLLVVDPLVYWVLAMRMISSQQSRKVQYFTRVLNGRRCDQFFVAAFIGREKMKDLRRQLNPVVTNSTTAAVPH